MHDEVIGGLGFVGYLTGVNLEILESFWKAGVVPVASCMGLGADGELYNINADHMAAACAEYIHADRLIYLTDVAGVLDGSKVVKVVSTADAEDMIRQNKVSGGMILKIEACKRALNAGVSEVRIVGGSVPKDCWPRPMARGFPVPASRPNFPPVPPESCSEIALEKSEENGSSGTAASNVALKDASRHLMNTYKRSDMIFTHGRGCYVFDQNGKKYLDFLGGIAVNALGYSYPDLVKTIRREAGRAVHVSNLFHNPFQGPLAAKLAKWSGMDRVFFTNSGSEAVEGALKLARIAAKKKPGGATKTRFLALEHSFHGRTFGALSITHPVKYREPFEPLVPGVDFVRLNDVSDLEAKFTDEVCAIIIEPIQGEGGIYPVSKQFWERARELATQHGAALIADEIQCGLGRTGKEFAYQRLEGLPDIVIVAKPLAGGLPLGAFLAREEFASSFVPGLHGSTFGGGPLTCATGLTFLNTVDARNCWRMCAPAAPS